MGVDIADFDGDGRLDLYGAQVFSDALYLGGDSGFESAFASLLSGGDPSQAITGWGAAFADLDDDGLPDVITTSAYGSTRDVGAAGGDDTIRTGWMMVLHHTIEAGTHRLESPTQLGAALEVPLDGYGLALGDIDNDGDLDVLVGVGNDERWSDDARDVSTLLINDGLRAGSNASIRIRLRQPGPNPFAVGARIEVIGRGLRTSRIVTAGSSYLSQHSYEQHFGLGAYDRAPIVRVSWPDGGTSLWLDLPAGAHTLDRGERCCTTDGCTNDDDEACLKRLRGADCGTACERVSSCCAAACHCDALPPPDSVLECLATADCGDVTACLQGRYAFDQPPTLGTADPIGASTCAP